jgi:hypothetical protein
MGLITTQNAGFGSPTPKPNQPADPKPVTGFNYAGQPMRPGDSYNGRPEHMAPTDQDQTKTTPGASQTLTDTAQTTDTDNNNTNGPNQVVVSRTHGLTSGLTSSGKWTAEKRRQFSEKMKAWHRDRKAKQRAGK